MQTRIQNTKSALMDLKQYLQGQSPPIASSEAALKDGFKQLDALLLEAEQGWLSEKQFQKRHDYLVMGILLCAFPDLSDHAADKIQPGVIQKDLFYIGKTALIRVVNPTDDVDHLYRKIATIIVVDKKLKLKEFLPFFWKLIPEPAFDAYRAERFAYQEHLLVYLLALQDQEKAHRRYEKMGRAFAIIAAFIPPIALFFSIPHVFYTAKEAASQHQRDAKFWLSALLLLISTAMIPVLSGLFIYRLLPQRMDERRKQDAIQHEPVNWRGIKDGHKTRMYNRLKINKPGEWQTLKQAPTEKPKAVYYYRDHQPVEILMDKAQYDRRLAMHLNYHTPLTTEIYPNDFSHSSGITIQNEKSLDIPFFKASYAKSKAIVERLQKKYMR